MNRVKTWLAITAGLASVALSAPAYAADAADGADALASGGDDAIIVTGTRQTFNNSAITDEMLQLRTPLTSQLSAINDLPGVTINEGDTYGFDDWSTAIAIRGFQTNLDTQQIGITIDGLPNGNSNYGGGAKANRYIDTLNTGGISVSQGTADIASRSNEALGGTIDFQTSDPLSEQRMRFSASVGQFRALKGYARYDTGDMANGKFKAWMSISHQEATDWVNGAAKNRRDNIAGKFVADLMPVKLTGYASYDDTYENNYEQMYDAASFAKNPTSDTLTAEWSGIPWIDQMYRLGWATLRKNFFTYLKADAALGNKLNLHASAYFHRNSGRGDWLPPYMVDVINDGAGNPQSELTGAVKMGGSPLGKIYYVDAHGVALTADPNCASSLTFPYGGAGRDYDPACYPAGAVPVMSFRHTHYAKDRIGGTVDFDWTTQLGDVDNLVRGGLWYEDVSRNVWRDWHKVIDARVGMEYENPGYWTQYNHSYPQSTFKWYLADEVTLGSVTANAGVKQFITKVKRDDLFNVDPSVSLDSTSRLLFSGGLRWDTPVHGLQFFGGYAENYKAISDWILDRPTSDLSAIKPETSRNIEAGLRYSSGRINASATYFDTRFKNRIIFVAAGSVTGIDYLQSVDGKYFNGGGIKTNGFEFVLSARVTPNLGIYQSYTHTVATYLGTGLADLDNAQGITPGNYETGIPKNMFATTLNWKNGPFAANLSGKFTGDRYVDTANDWKAHGYYLVDFNVSVDAKEISDVLKGMRLDLTVNNLLQKHYLGGISGGAAWIGAPRTTVLTLTADF